MNNLLYNALMLGRNKNIANEEFLVSEGKKLSAAFRVREETIDIEEVTEDTFVHLTLEQTVQGYLEIEIYCSEEIVELDKKILTSDDFREGKLTIPVKIAAEKLHNGKNFAKIFFRTHLQEIGIPVVVNNRIRIFRGENAARKLLIELEENYLDLRMNRIESSAWISKSLKLLEDIYGADRRSLFLMLYRAQLYIMQGTMDKANYIMDFVSEQLPKLTEPDYELSCYYLYVRSLYKMDDRETEEAVNKLRLVHARVPSWKILWMLFYMDYRYKNEPERKLAELEAVFELGYSSPEMYFEALEIYRARPNLLKNVSEFELQVLNFAAKREYFNSAVVDRLPELIFALGDKELHAVNTKLAVNILKAFYKNDPSSSVLKAICALLIFSGNKEHAGHEYFKKAVREAFSIPGLYEYYVFTSDKEKKEPFPDKIITYFSEGTESLKEDRSYYYANLIHNRYLHPDYYRGSINGMITYAEGQLAAGKADDFIGEICTDILNNGLATRKIQQDLFSIICKKKIECHNPRITSVLVFHNELNLYQDVFLEKGKAFVNIFSGSALVLFKDITGNIYKNIEYEKTNLIDTNEYIDMCIKEAPINRYMILEDTLPLLKAYKDPVDILQYLSNQLSTGLLRAEYEKRLMRDAVMGFSQNRDMNIYDELLEFWKFNLDEETRGRLIEIMIARTLYKQAFEAIGRYGFEYISNDAVAKLTHVMVNLSNYHKADPLLLKLCEHSFKTTAFDPDIFDYLVNFCEDDVALLVDLYRAAAAYERNPDAIAERIIRRAVEEKINPDGTFHVFSKYYERGQDEELKDAYLSFRAIDYLSKEGKTDKDFFKFLENGFLQKKTYDVRVYVAYLYYIAGVFSPGSTQKKLVEGILRDMVRQGVMLEKFKELKKYFTLPSTLANSVIASVFSDESDAVPVIRYCFGAAEDVDAAEPKEMSRIFEGCYARYFTLFAGEQVTYRINEEEPVTVHYKDLDIMTDESRFSELDLLIREMAEGNFDRMKELAGQYYVKDKLIDRIFNSEDR